MDNGIHQKSIHRFRHEGISSATELHHHRHDSTDERATNAPISTDIPACQHRYGANASVLVPRVGPSAGRSSPRAPEDIMAGSGLARRPARSAAAGGSRRRALAGDARRDAERGRGADRLRDRHQRRLRPSRLERHLLGGDTTSGE